MPPKDNCVHKSSVNYGNLRCHFQDRASASIHICPAVKGHLPEGLWCRYWPDSGDFRELRASMRSIGLRGDLIQNPKSGVEDVHIIGRLMEQIDHAGAPRENRIIRFDELKTTDAARPLKWAESHVVGPSWRIAAKIGRASQ
jgi:hypothetical protein